MNRAHVRLVVFIIVLLYAVPILADESTESQEAPPEINPENVDSLSVEDFANNIQQIVSNPILIRQVSGEKLAEVAAERGYGFLQSNGLMGKLDADQARESGLYDDPGTISDFSADVRSEIESERSGTPITSIQGDPVTARDVPGGGREYIGATSVTTSTGTITGSQGSVQVGPTSTRVDQAASVSVSGPSGQTATPPTSVATPGDTTPSSQTTTTTGSQQTQTTPPGQPRVTPASPPPGTQPAQPGLPGATTTPNIRGGPNEATQADPRGTPSLTERREGQLLDDQNTNAANQDSQRQVTQSSFTNVQGFEARGNTFKVARADSIIFTFDDGRVEISTDVEGFESDSDSFRVRKARQVSVDGISIENVNDAEFSMGRTRLSDAASDILGLPNASSKVVIINSGPGVFPVTDRSGNEVLFTATGNSTLAISFDDENPIYILHNGNLNITPDTPMDEPFTEQINAGNSSAQVIINKALGVLYVKLNPPAAYIYIPESIEKTFALQSTKEVHEIFFSKESRRPLKNHCSQCTKVDFVSKMIKLKGILDYKRYFFLLKNGKYNLIEPNLKGIFLPNSTVEALFKYDNDMRFIERLQVTNGTDVEVHLANWVTAKAFDNQDRPLGIKTHLVPKNKVSESIISEFLFNGHPPIRSENSRGTDRAFSIGSNGQIHHHKNQAIQPFFEWLLNTLHEVIT